MATYSTKHTPTRQRGSGVYRTRVRSRRQRGNGKIGNFVRKVGQKMLPKLKPMAGKVGKQLIGKLPGLIMAGNKKEYAKKAAIEVGKGVYSDLMNSGRHAPKRRPKRWRGGYRMKKRW